jgi:hypothetical protein
MRTKFKLLVVALLFAIQANSQGYTISATGPDMNIGRLGHFAFLLDQDRAIVIGGRTTAFALTNTAEIYNHISNMWTLRTMPYSHAGATVAYIDNGKYLIMGGSDSGSFSGTNYTTIYDAINDTFYSGPSMLNTHIFCSSARLGNDKILVVGNMAMSATPELFDIDSNKFVAAGALSDQRASAMVLPTNDGNAYVFGGGNSILAPVYSVEEYHAGTNTFSTVSSQLIPSDPGWEVHKSLNATMNNNRLSDGKYAFLISKKNGYTTHYRIMTFDPASKAFAVFNTSPSLPDRINGLSGQWSLANNIIVDDNEDYIYIDAISGTYAHKLLIVDASTGELAIPISYNTYNHDISSASKFLVPGGEIAYTGGSIDPISVSDDYTLIEPMVSFGITELSENGGWFYAYPNPAARSEFYVVLPQVEIDELVIVDLAGRVVKRLETNGCGGELTVARGNLPSGIYMVVMNYNGIKSITRLILK